MKYLLFSLCMCLSLFGIGQRKQAELGVQVYQYKLDSVWIANGPPDTAVTELWKKGKVESYQTVTATIELHVSVDETFRDRLILLDPLFDVKDTLYIAMTSHLAGKEFISLFMQGYLKKENVGKAPFDYFIHYIVINKKEAKFVLFRRDYPLQRALYFVHLQDAYILPKK